jgi:hypothetical protein
VIIQGSGFASQSVSIHFGTHPTITPTQSSPNGTFSATFTVPAQTPGTKVIATTDTEGNFATTTFFIIPSSISVSPSSALAGKEITIQGSSFLGNRNVTIHFGTHLTISTTTAGPNGTFSCTFLVPEQTPGTKIITVTDTEGNLVTTTFILLPPTFLKILPAYSLIAKNQEFDVDVRIEDVRNLKGSEVHLSFDPDILEVLELNNGSFPSGGLVLKGSSSGKIDYTMILFSGSATGSGVLCQAKLKGKEAGTTSIRFDFDQPHNRMTMLADNQNQMIPFNKEESLVYVANTLSVSPENKCILAGNSQGYSAYAKCEAGSVNVTSSATFSASGGGSFTANIFEAHYIGTYTIQAEFLGLIGTTNVYITSGTPTTLLYVSGNNQTSTCTKTLSHPFIVKVEDSYHNPCSNVAINFAVISYPTGAEGYSLSSTQTLTNINGTTSSYLTLGDEPPGSYTIRVTSGSLTPYDFTGWSLRRFGNLAGICLIDYGTTAGIQAVASITITIIETGATTTTNSNSYFIFTNIPTGTYTLSFSYPGATPATRTAIITQTQFNATQDLGTITLIMGDPNIDGQINMLDWPYIADSYGSQLGDQNYNPSCDFNSDGQINLLDLLIFTDNFGQQQQQGKAVKAKTKTRDRTITLSFEPNLIEKAKIGEIITMRILVSGAENSYGGEVHLSFNPDLLEAIDVNKGYWVGEGLYYKRIDQDRGRIDLALGSLKPITDSSGCFATITFRVKAEGESAIKFEFDEEDNRKTLFIEKGNVVPEITHNEIKIEVVPIVSILLQSYPNPAKDLCYIPFKLSEDTEVTVEVYNILGQKVKEINAGYKKAGLYLTKETALSYNLKNDRGDKLSQGLYFINLRAGRYSGRGRLVISR